MKFNFVLKCLSLLSWPARFEFSLEYETPLWILSMDLRKAFDTIDHSALFDGLRAHGIPEEYINLIMLLYSKQIGVVNDIKFFEIKREVKQGDVLSAIFFNCVLDIVFDSWKSKLQYEGHNG